MHHLLVCCCNRKEFDSDSGEEWALPTPTKKRRVPPPSTDVSAVSSGSAGKWHIITDKDEQPSLPHFKPKRPPGPHLMPGTKYSPLELFQLFFSKSVVTTLVDNTNKFAENRLSAGKNFRWVPVSVNELYTFISIVIYMGLVKAKTLADYWSRNRVYRLPFPGTVMTKARFLTISWNLHLSDPQEDMENLKKKGSPGFDRLFKIKPLYVDIVSACRTFFQPRREISIDERMVATKARNGLKQYMKNKPTKWGQKLFVLADSSNGYTWNFFVYEGKNTMSSGKGLGYDSVMALLEFSLLGRGYKVYTDNFYTTPRLFLNLLQENTVACGTIRPNQRDFPKTKVNDLPKNADRGTIRWCRHGNLLFVKWKDTREVNMCTTIHKAYAGDRANRRVKNSKGVWTSIPVPIPAAIKDYNQHMGGVGLSDTLLGYYGVLHKTRKWYKTFFFHFIDIAIVNSFILHKEMIQAHRKDHLTQKKFRETLQLQLADISKMPWQEELVTLAQPVAPPAHCMVAFYSTDATSSRRACRLCKQAGKRVKTPAYCTKCNVALCLLPARNCFKDWHDSGNHKNV